MNAYTIWGEQQSLFTKSIKSILGRGRIAVGLLTRAHKHFLSPFTTSIPHHVHTQTHLNLILRCKQWHIYSALLKKKWLCMENGITCWYYHCYYLLHASMHQWQLRSQWEYISNFRKAGTWGLYAKRHQSEQPTPSHWSNIVSDYNFWGRTSLMDFCPLFVSHILRTSLM